VKRKQSKSSNNANTELLALVGTLRKVGQRLEKLTAGQVETVADSDGRTLLLSGTQEQLKQSQNAKQAAILNALPAHIALLDAKGIIISVNEVWRRFDTANVLQGNPAYDVGRNYLEACDDACAGRSSIAAQVAEGIRSVLSRLKRSFATEYQCDTPTENRWCLLTVTPLAENRPTGAVLMHLNITEQKQVALELPEANERMTILDRAKAEFLDVISHEFRTPLCGLFTVGDLIIEGIASPEENVELKGMFQRSRRRILSILDDALLLTRIDVTRDQFGSAPVSLSTALSCAIERTTEFADSRHVTFVMPSANQDIVVGDKDLLVLAFHALLDTAVKFSKEGETVRVAHEVAADSLRVTIETHGWTISPSAMPKFFDIFSVGEILTPGGDLGLGPPVAYRILSLFGASVSVANRNSCGIRLTISLRKAAPSGAGTGLLNWENTRVAGKAQMLQPGCRGSGA
jgi:signal transduction histidine kinase